MNSKKTFLLGLDYELYFGAQTGGVEKCMLEPTEAIAALLEKYGFRLSLFVDVGYLCRTKSLMHNHARLRHDYTAVVSQLREFLRRGHDVQLHVHPHWEDAIFDGEQWTLPVERFRLHDFSQSDISEILQRYAGELRHIADRDIFAYRAGGWCMQPFETIAAPLRSAGIWMDSTVYTGGYSEDPNHGYDFRGAPQADFYRFNTDPNIADENGAFVELPITPCRFGPDFFWRLALARKLKLSQHQGFGDGSPIPSSGAYYLRKLTQSSTSVASVDGMKAAWLERCFQSEAGNKQRPNYFNAMGHPKALTPSSLTRLDKFLSGRGDSLSGATFWDLKDLKPSTA